MINLISDQKVWSKNQIRKRSEAYIQSFQTHGDEAMLTRVNDAALMKLRPMSDGEQSYLDNHYLPRAIEGGELAARMTQDNIELARLIKIQSTLKEFLVLKNQLNSVDPTTSKIDSVDGSETETSEYVQLTSRLDVLLETLAEVRFEDWELVAKRLEGIDVAPEAITLAVIRTLPTLDLLKRYVELSELGSVDVEQTLEFERERLIDLLSSDMSDVN